MWKNFEGIARTREQTLERINALQWTDWRPQGITLHNTALPTLAQWAETGAAHDARIRNLQEFYEDKGWHAGPHWFVSRNWINWFSNPLLPGVHSRCFNTTRFGIEMVGDYAKEEFNSGDGAMVRDNAVFLIAALNLKFNFDPEDLKFHVECKQDNHDCPGKKVVKADVISRVREMMAALRSGPAISARPRLPAASSSAAASRRVLNIPATEFGGEGTSNLLLMRMCLRVGPIVPALRCLVGSPGRVPRSASSRATGQFSATSSTSGLGIQALAARKTNTGKQVRVRVRNWTTAPTGPASTLRLPLLQQLTWTGRVSSIGNSVAPRRSGGSSNARREPNGRCSFHCWVGSCSASTTSRTPLPRMRAAWTWANADPIPGHDSWHDPSHIRAG